MKPAPFDYYAPDSVEEAVALLEKLEDEDTGEIFYTRIRCRYLDEEACRAARENLSARSLKKTTVHSGDGLQIYREIGDRFQLAILDPPRTGHRELARALGQGKQKSAIYVSCNPATLARDLKELVSSDYRIERVLPFDMFPQTPHVETLALLEKK